MTTKKKKPVHRSVLEQRILGLEARLEQASCYVSIYKRLAESRWREMELLEFELAQEKVKRASLESENRSIRKQIMAVQS